MHQTLILAGILLPFLGTSLGAGAVFLLKRSIADVTQKALFGFAAGVMLAASVWSLLIPSIEWEEGVVQTAGGFLFGVGLFLLFDGLFLEKSNTSQKKRSSLALAVTLHNVPEGMAIGIAFAGVAARGDLSALGGAMLLSLGIGMQNVPEGAVVSMPLKGSGLRRRNAFFVGVVSGAVEPLGALAAFFLTRWIEPVLPFFLSFAAGAMVYVTEKELIPSLQGKGEWLGHFSLGVGFALMMCMDVLLG